MVLIYTVLISAYSTKKQSFRPLAGIMVLIWLGNTYNRRLSESFRPLAGIMVLIRIDLL